MPKAKTPLSRYLRFGKEAIINGRLTPQLLTDYCGVSYHTIWVRFGSWALFCELLDVEPGKLGGDRRSASYRLANPKDTT